MIRMHRDGKERRLVIPEFEAITGAAFIWHLDFADCLQDIVETIETYRKKGELSREQLWWGSYYKTEIQTLYLPDVSIRWIDESVGWGVFAEKAFKKGEYVAEYAGKVRPRLRRDKKNAYCFEYLLAPHIPTAYTIDAQDQGGVGRFINHSSRPNLQSLLATVEGINHVIVVAKDPISEGTQLCYDYGPDYWSCRSKPMILTS